MPTKTTQTEPAAADPATTATGQEPTDDGARQEPTPSPQAAETDGAAFSPAEQAKIIADLRKENAKHRKRVVKAEEKASTLEAAAKKESDAALESQGEFKTLYEQQAASIAARDAQVIGVIASNALRAAIGAKGVPDSVLKRLTLPTDGITVDSATFAVTGVEDVVAELMADLEPLIAAKAAEPAPVAPPNPVIVAEHRREDASSSKTMKVDDISAYAAEALRKAGIGTTG